ncbi:hypothetical protein [Sphingobacterium bambusae]|uniref:Uncharacterized protein n=1 Tax=Sphingobacterium bambusae TaxID=662858 RepID=A0ABW6BDG1_9SPHI|nr:hypothetical protein [Sphingobacterium bambusae]WPL48783.1 hypothetical protein SCB77_22795 [Sphingobacterium bambusae]
MTTVRKQFTFLKDALLLFVVLFALLPCSAKAFLLLQDDVSYTRTLNKVKTIGSNVDRCTASHEMLAVAKNADIKVPCHVPPFVNYVDFLTPHLSWSLIQQQHVFVQTEQESYLPPKYILFKRLKLGVA